jgi:hypothetical protein
MKWILNSLKSQQVHRLAVAVAITGGAAAVAASAMLAERSGRDPSLAASGRPALVSGGSGFSSDQRGRIRSPKDADRLMPGPWVKRSRVDASADQAGAGVTSPTDASLPAAAEALKDLAVEATELPPTF